ncbi:ROK family transcriptional regulator [Arthrobacter tecti]
MACDDASFGYPWLVERFQPPAGVPPLATASSVRSSEQTRSFILDTIRASGRISRVELAKKSGLTEATISTVVRRVIAEGLIIEAGFSESTGGKRRTLLEINSSARYALGVSLDRERLVLVAADLSGKVVGSAETPGTGDTYPGTVIKLIASRAAELLKEVNIDPATVVGIGVASPGPLDTRAGVLRGHRPSSAWRDYPLEERLEEQSGFPVVLDNDATCAALGEYWTNNVLVTAPVSATVYMADGIGCGILVNGQIYHGSSSNAGEIGHVTLDIAGPKCHCGSRGCVELYAAPAAVAARALANKRLTRELKLTPKVSSSRENFDSIAKGAVEGNTTAHALIMEAAVYLAEGIVSLSNVLDLDEVHLSGPGFSIAGEIFAEVIQGRLNEGTFMRAIHPVLTKLSTIGDESAAVGAAALVLQHQLTPHLAARSRRARGNVQLVAAESLA